MIKVDWRMAPDWADGHGLISWQGITEVWISAEQYAVVGCDGGPYPWGGGTCDTRHNHALGQVEYITPRPDRWGGEGLPPVGSDCEYFDGGEWMRCEVVAHRNNAAVVLSDCYEPAFVAQQELRPIRTPEQIAAEERERDIKQMISDTHILAGTMGNRRLMAEQLYDAGYRKQEAS